ncbi:hypothetical protein [Luteococcus sediminum]
MSRRVSLPGASELFRPTSSTAGEAEPQPDLVEQAAQASPEPQPAPERSTARKSAPRKTTARRTEPAQQAPAPAKKAPAPRSAAKSAAATDAADRRRGASGRVRHDEKITVYVSSEELLALEQARLTLRAEHGLAVDRGRIVRESVALVMADLAARGADSDLVRRLETE